LASLPRPVALPPPAGSAPARSPSPTCFGALGQQVALRAHRARLADVFPDAGERCFEPLAAGEAQQLRLGQAAARYRESESLPIWDILFPRLASGRNGAECRPFRSFIRTTGTGSDAHFGPYPISLRPLSLTQPNHDHFGTVVRSPPDQWVMRCQLGCGFESAALKRSEQGSNNSIRYRCRADKDRAPRGVAGTDRRSARQGRIGQAARAGRLTVA
jgi:hypothetical protein